MLQKISNQKHNIIVHRLMRDKYTNKFTRVNDMVPVPLPGASAIDAAPGMTAPTSRNPFWIGISQDLIIKSQICQNVAS